MKSKKTKQSEEMPWMILSLVLIIVIILLVVFSLTQIVSPSKVATPQTDKVVVSEQLIVGDVNALITLEEWSDLECPFCKKFYQEAYQEILTSYINQGKVKLRYRHFPLESIHPNALISAIGLECANEQGLWIALHDKIFEESAAPTSQNLKTWAQEIGANTEQFNNCLDTQKYAEKVRQEMAQGEQFGVSGTPSFRINEGAVFSGALPFQEFKRRIDAELQRISS